MESLTLSCEWLLDQTLASGLFTIVRSLEGLSKLVLGDTERELQCSFFVNPSSSIQSDEGIEHLVIPTIWPPSKSPTKINEHYLAELRSHSSNDGRQFFTVVKVSHDRKSSFDKSNLRKPKAFLRV